ncbi:MAG: adenylate/guanylate cyclase domain-containing protein [Spirochaetaceae bacterium]|jgi:adenylate cyclase|nr:adenylate/guanylate cyclase domain-containing protein [Spirochaetaceae bacterium]
MNNKIVKTAVVKKAVIKKTKYVRVYYGIILINSFFLIVSTTINLVSMWNNSKKNAEELSQALIEEIQNSVSYRTINYFYPAQTMNHSLAFLTYRYFDDPLHNPLNQEQLFDYYAEIQKLHSQFKMVYYANTSGDLMMLLRMSDGTFSKRFVKNDGSHIQIRYEHANPGFYGTYPNSDEPLETGYDPRKRTWYKIAEAARSMTWTPVYLFATGHLPGFTCSVPVFDDHGTITGVSSIDITVDELSRFLGTLRPTPGTKIFILDKQNNLVALQARSEGDLNALFVTSEDDNGNTTYEVSSIDAFADKPTRSILQHLVQKPGTLTQIKEGDKNYQAILTPINVGAGLDLNIGIIIPEEDITGHLFKNLQTLTLFSIGLLILILIASALLSSAISTPMRQLANAMMKIKSFDLDSAVIIRTVFQEIINMRDSFESMKKGLRNFKRYVPAELVSQLVSEEINADIGGEKRELTVFFSDIANFTSIAEQIKAEDLVLNLCTYFEILSKAILKNHGTIDKYIGDSVMAFWGAPTRIENHAEQACLSALLIRNKLYVLSKRWENSGKTLLHTRMGIHTGDAIVGNMGYHERLNYTVIGDTVNVSSRLEGINKVYGTSIIVSESTRNQCWSSFEFRRLDRVSVTGRKKALEIYELIAQKGLISASLKKLYRYYEAGLNRYFDQKWDEAINYFNTVLKYKPSDNPSKVLLERCRRYKQNPPPPDWNGVFIQKAKEI